MVLNAMIEMGPIHVIAGSHCNYMYIVTNLLHQLVLVYFCGVHVLVENNFVIEIIMTLLKIARPLLGKIENLQ